MSQVSKSHCAKMRDLSGTFDADECVIHGDVGEPCCATCESCIGEFVDIAGAFADGETICSAFDVFDAVAEFVESESANVDERTELDALAEFAFVASELPQVLSKSRSACSSRSNSSWSGTPCGAYRIIISVMTCAFAVLSKSLRKSLRQSKSVASLMNCNSVFGFCRKTTSLNASGSSAPRNGDSFLFPPLTINDTIPHSSVSALTIQLESLYGKRCRTMARVLIMLGYGV